MRAPPVPSTDDIVIRLLEAGEANRVVDAITAAYGETYDVPWYVDVSVASDHGRELLDYVLGDLP